MDGIDRRYLLGAAAAAAAASLAPARLFAAQPAIPVAKRRMLQLNGYAPDVETPLDALEDAALRYVLAHAGEEVGGAGRSRAAVLQARLVVRCAPVDVS